MFIQDYGKGKETSPERGENKPSPAKIDDKEQKPGQYLWYLFIILPETE